MKLTKIWQMSFFILLTGIGACSSYQINPEKMTPEEKLALPPEFYLHPQITEEKKKPEETQTPQPEHNKLPFNEKQTDRK